MIELFFQNYIIEENFNNEKDTDNIKIYIYIYIAISTIISLIAAYLSWNCNKGLPLSTRLLCASQAFSLGIFYIIYHVIGRLIYSSKKNPFCATCDCSSKVSSTKGESKYVSKYKSSKYDPSKHEPINYDPFKYEPIKYESSKVLSNRSKSYKTNKMAEISSTSPI
jgi:hypothetical protein